MDCSPSNLIWVGVGALVLGALTMMAILIVVGARTGGSGRALMEGLREASGQRERLAQTGVAGGARIVSVAETVITVNDAPMVDLVLDVTIPGRPVNRVSCRDRVPRLAIGRLTDGRPLRVMVDPAQPDLVAVDWLAQPEP